MYKPFETIEELYREIDEDKHWTGAESSVRSRYPIRFVLFENFSDFNDFVQECSNHEVYVQSMEKWMDAGYDDQLMTYSQLARRFEEYIKSLPANDFVIAPFSEIVRFYDNEKYAEFDALEKKLQHNLDHDLDYFATDIRSMIAVEIVKRYYYQRGAIIEQLKEDEELKSAVDILASPTTYHSILHLPTD